MRHLVVGLLISTGVVSLPQQCSARHCDRLSVSRCYCYLYCQSQTERSRQESSGSSRRSVSDPEQRVARAKQFLAEAAAYPRGCSQFISKVLDIDYEQANAIMGNTPASLGTYPNYHGLKRGAIVGWKNSPGHVAIVVNEPGTKFIDVKDDGDKPRRVERGYGAQELFKSSRF